MHPEHDHAPDPAHPAHADRLLAQHSQALRARFPLPAAQVSRSQRPRRLAMTTALLVLVSGTLLWLDPAYRSERLVSQVGQRNTATLADGSTITLNTDSALDVSWHLRSRRVTLERGQALFDVSHATWRPFSVEAGHTRVSVVGTLFEVWRQPESVRVTVLRGKVRVDNLAIAAPPAYLVADQQIASAPAGLSSVMQVDAASSMAWREGRLVFDHTPLRLALQELQRYTRAGIAEPDPQVGGLQLSGVFDTDRADALLELLPGILPVTLGRNAQGEIEVRKVVAKK